MYRLFRPFLFLLDPERSHRLALHAARHAERAEGISRRIFGEEDERLAQSLLGLRFPNPVGLAAGYDKSAERLEAWPALGFGFSEIGSVTARPSDGNPRPRLFRLPDDRALINRMGLNNDGADVVAGRLSSHSSDERATPVGVNITKTNDPEILGEAALEDFETSLARLAPFADYLALNVSCPNTSDGKTFEEPDALDGLLSRMMSARSEAGLSVPMLVKFAPPGVSSGGVMDLGRFDELVATAVAHDVAGFILTNTAPDRVNLASDPSRLARIGAGGLSGRPIAERALAATKRAYATTGGRLPIIGVGGIDSAEAAYARIRAGASLVEVFTGLVYEGPRLPRRICRGLLRLLEHDGLDSIADAVGIDA